MKHFNIGAERDNSFGFELNYIFSTRNSQITTDFDSWNTGHAGFIIVIMISRV